MRTITAAELSENPTGVLEAVEAGEGYVVTRDRLPIARLLPVIGDVVVTPARVGEPSRLADRPRMGLHTYEQTNALLRELSSEP